MILNLIILLALHFVADFLLQSRSMGINKGKSIMWLSMHVGVYLTTFLIFGILVSPYICPHHLDIIVQFCVLNASFHWCTDLITSKLSGFCYKRMIMYDDDLIKKNRWQYYFWAVIGLDQFIHCATLLLTYSAFFV